MSVLPIVVPKVVGAEEAELGHGAGSRRERRAVKTKAPSLVLRASRCCATLARSPSPSGGSLRERSRARAIPRRTQRNPTLKVVGFDPILSGGFTRPLTIEAGEGEPEVVELISSVMKSVTQSKLVRSPRKTEEKVRMRRLGPSENYCVC